MNRRTLLRHLLGGIAVLPFLTLFGSLSTADVVYRDAKQGPLLTIRWECSVNMWVGRFELNKTLYTLSHPGPKKMAVETLTASWSQTMKRLENSSKRICLTRGKHITRIFHQTFKDGQPYAPLPG